MFRLQPDNSIPEYRGRPEYTVKFRNKFFLFLFCKLLCFKSFGISGLPEFTKYPVNSARNYFFFFFSKNKFHRISRFLILTFMFSCFQNLDCNLPDNPKKNYQAIPEEIHSFFFWNFINSEVFDDVDSEFFCFGFIWFILCRFTVNYRKRISLSYLKLTINKGFRGCWYRNSLFQTSQYYSFSENRWKSQFTWNFFYVFSLKSFSEKSFSGCWYIGLQGFWFSVILSGLSG